MSNLIKAALLISALFSGAALTACNPAQNKSTNMESHQHHEGVYACPMHPEVTGNKGDKCPKCGMDLVPASNPAKVEVALNTEPQAVEAGAPAKLTFTFRENGKNTLLDISHEMKVHLMILDEALSWFRHIHPEEQPDGSYTISETFPSAGKYILFSDFKPQGTAGIVDKKEIAVKGISGNTQADFSNKFVSVVDGYTVTLENGNDLKTGRLQSLEFSVVKDGQKRSESDIEPYLGATAHIAMISKEDKDFLHIHPVSDKSFPIYAETQVKKPGIYRLWVEFQTNGKVHTADFTVPVVAGEKTAGDEGHHSHSH